MKPAAVSHLDYRSFLSHSMEQQGIHWRALPAPLRQTFLNFRALDLSAVDSLLRDKYSIFGPAPRQPSCMFRSLLLMLDQKAVSVTEWVNRLQTAPFLAILSGFVPDDVPGVGTFYDFINRLWNKETPNFSPHEKPPTEKVKKPRKKGEKAESIEKESVADLIVRLSGTAFSSSGEAFDTLLSIFQNCFLDESIRRKAILPGELNIAGDGTPVVTAHRFRAHHTCDCISKGIFDCTCSRYYPQPDCDLGWDSSHNCFFFGYDLYLLSDAASGLPLFPYLFPASKHDSHAFCESYFRFRAFLPQLKPRSLLLDSAHDSMAMYRLCDREQIKPFIDLNPGNSRKKELPNGITIGTDGIPVCNAGLRMKPNGIDHSRSYAKFRCPMMSKGACTCTQPCSSAKFGRTCSLPNDDNIRLYTNPPRASDAWKLMYNKRTAAERCNKRIKLDYLLETAAHRSSRCWYVRVYLILMLLHLDAWAISE